MKSKTQTRTSLLPEPYRQIALNAVRDLAPFESQIVRSLKEITLDIKHPEPRHLKMPLDMIPRFDPRPWLHRMATSVGWRIGRLNPSEEFPDVVANATLYLDDECAEVRRIVRAAKELGSDFDLEFPEIVHSMVSWDDRYGWVHELHSKDYSTVKFVAVDWNLVRATWLSLSVTCWGVRPDGNGVMISFDIINPPEAAKRKRSAPAAA